MNAYVVSALKGQLPGNLMSSRVFSPCDPDTPQGLHGVKELMAVDPKISL